MGSAKALSSDAHGYSVFIKGEAAAEAVLCTEESTYALKLVETTNSLLLVPPAQVSSELKL